MTELDRRPREGGATRSGTAGFQCECVDGTCKHLTCSLTGATNYEDAKYGLEAKVESKVKAENGKVVGSISLKIKKDL